MASSALEDLVRCAQAIEDGDLKLADSLLEQIWNLASDESDKLQRNLVKLFAEALVRRACGLHSDGSYSTLELTPYFYPYWVQFSFHISVQNVIKNAVMGKKRLHLIDFYIPHVRGWGYLFDGLNSNDFLSVRVSAIIPFFLKKYLNIQKEKEYLSDQAKICNVKLEEEENLKVVYANSLGEVDDSMLDFRKTEDEGVVVYCSFKLHKLLAEVGAIERELLKLRHINPDIVIIKEQDANLNDSKFITRLKDSFQYYSDVIDLEYSSYETNNYYRQQIHNILGCEGRDRIVRQQTLAQWRSCLLKGGFLPIPLELNKNFIIEMENDEIHEDNGSLVLFKKNRPMIFVSAWKLKDGEEHFNPSSNNLEEKGFNPSLLLEDGLQRLQPLPVFPEGLSLNHLAAVSEIYEMLEEVSVAYDLPLALTWACGVYVNEIGYKKHTLFIQSTFCCANDEYEDYIEECERRELLKRHAIAGKALQSSEHFHFEPSISKLKQADHPLAPNQIPNHAVMAICLQNYYNVYVVEFFLLPGSKSLALQIFNDLKNMQKKFVTVRGVLQGLNVQGEVIPNFHPPLPMHASSPPGFHKQGIGKQTPCEPLAINENEMVKADLNNLPISSAKRRKLTSKVWEEFDKQDVGGKKCAICKHCERKFDGSSKKGTTHLRNHLRICKKRAEKDRDQPLIFPAGRGDSKNGSASEGISSFDQDRSSMDVARMIIKNHFRLNIVEDEFFNILLKNLQPMFKLQSQESLSSYIFCVYEEEKHKLRGYFDKLSCRFNLTISLWAHDVEKITYCCYGVQFIDDEWELKKKILVLKSLGNQFDKRIFYENFKDFCVDWNFNKKICSIIIHNSTSCSEIAEEIRKSWHSFEASHPLSTFYLGSDECIHGLLDKDNSGESVGKSIHSVTRTSNACLLSIHDIYKKLNQQEGREYPLMNVKSDNNWSTCSLVLAIAAVLDPRFKFAFVEFSYKKIYGHGAAKIHLTKIRNAFTDIFNEYASNMYSDTNSSTLLNAEENTMESFHKYVNTEASWKSELDKYVHQSIIDFTPEFDILSWWCEQASSFPVLGRMVRDILAIPMSSILSDSTFNEKVMMDTPIFSGLDPQIIEAMICGRDWLESPKKISNVESNKRSGNIGCSVVKLEDSPALAHHSDIERFSSESDNEALGNQDLGRGATWTQKDVRAYLLSPFTVEELEHFSKWKDHALSGESVGRDKIQGNALAPLLKIPPHDVDLEDAQNYYIEDTVVNQFFVLLKRRYERFPHKYPKHHSFDSSIATFLIKGTKAEYQVLSWVNQEDLKGVSKLFLPICLNEHWLLFFADIDDKKLLWLDSNEHSRMSNVLEKQVIQQWFLKFLLPSMKHDPKDWLFDVPTDIPLQKNSVDCALFVMKYADCLTHGNYFPFTQDDMPHFRYRTFLDLCLGSICLGRSQDDRVNHAPVQNMLLSSSSESVGEKAESMEASACSRDMLEMSKGRNVRRRHYRVVEQTPSGNWTAEFQDIPGRMHGLEAFETAEAAALAYDEATLRFRGTKAILNFPERVERVEGRLESGNLTTRQEVEPVTPALPPPPPPPSQPTYPDFSHYAQFLQQHDENEYFSG